MTNTITLTNPTINSGDPLRLVGGNFNYSWKNNVSADPSTDSFDVVETQFTGWENPMISLTFHIPVDKPISNSMTWALWNEFAKYEYDGSNQTTLSVTVGSSDSSFIDYSSTVSTSDVPVTVKSYALKFGADDSRQGYFWTINAQLQITK